VSSCWNNFWYKFKIAIKLFILLSNIEKHFYNFFILLKNKCDTFLTELFKAFTLELLGMYSRRRENPRRHGNRRRAERRMAEVGATIMRHVPLIKQKLRSRVCKWRLFARCRLARVRMTYAHGRTDFCVLQRQAGFRSRRAVLAILVTVVAILGPLIFAADDIYTTVSKHARSARVAAES